ncbi:transmembrane protease serine 5 isoform X2 [Oncorhynchus nerka]|uniref:transmembrane protease serine 5 isoform X2 n=1 Tax=Oncorhynchus nerka TaxID=8023 RepID=UPI0031B8A505
MNLDGDTLSVIENPVAVSHSFHPEKTGLGEARGAQSQSCHAWLRGIHSTNHMSANRLVRVLAAVCAVGLLGGLAVGVWFLVRLLLRPTSSQSPAGLGDTKETSFCNVTEDISVADPRKECGTRAKLPRIIGGVEATLGRWPWQVSLYYSNRHTCGGTIITSQWVVTAAHCVHNYRLPQVSSWVVYAGIVTRSSAKMSQYIGYPVEKILYNKNYNPRSHDNDIALMKLRTPLNFSDTIRPICLPQYERDLPGGTQCWISGWGYTQPDDVLIPATLKEAPVPLISTKKCNSSCMYNGEVTPRMLCAGYTEGKVDACQVSSETVPACTMERSPPACSVLDTPRAKWTHVRLVQKQFLHVQWRDHPPHALCWIHRGQSGRMSG